jgi:hypothetical protein
MKKSLIYSIILIGGLLFAAAFSNAQEPEAKKPETEQKVVKYTCQMHPEVVRKEPGKCPECGMDLVMKEKMHTEKKCEKKDTTKMHDEHMKFEKEGCEKKEDVKED